ncbi:MAG: CinA family protein [Firmicutes bacterium]|nr:CinA family protein [Bacillota bacterium]
MDLAAQAVQILRDHGLTAAVAESCTGGLLAAAFTDIPGSSQVFHGGVVTYSNAMKQRLLQVPREILEENGAVSRETAAAMLKGLFALSRADICLSVTGVAGPGPSGPDGRSGSKPQGLVYTGILYQGRITVVERRFDGGRQAVRRAAVEQALRLLLQAVAGEGEKDGQA